MPFDWDKLIEFTNAAAKFRDGYAEIQNIYEMIQEWEETSPDELPEEIHSKVFAMSLEQIDRTDEELRARMLNLVSFHYTLSRDEVEESVNLLLDIFALFNVAKTLRKKSSQR